MAMRKYTSGIATRKSSRVAKSSAQDGAEKVDDMRAIVLVALIFVGVAVWWMESRFGPTFAMAVTGSLIGAIIVIVGVFMGLISNRHSLQSAAEFHTATMQTEQQRLALERERQRSDTEIAKQNTIALQTQGKMQLLDAKRVDQLAQQRAQFLARPAESQTWGEFADYEEDEEISSDSFRFYE